MWIFKPLLNKELGKNNKADVFSKVNDFNKLFFVIYVGQWIHWPANLFVNSNSSLNWMVCCYWNGNQTRLY